jgi:hypothetical protein
VKSLRTDAKRCEMTACSFGSQGRRLDLIPEGKSACFPQRDWIVLAYFAGSMIRSSSSNAMSGRLGEGGAFGCRRGIPISQTVPQMRDQRTQHVSIEEGG